jgi:hypothetical protein
MSHSGTPQGCLELASGDMVSIKRRPRSSKSPARFVSMTPGPAVVHRSNTARCPVSMNVVVRVAKSCCALFNRPRRNRLLTPFRLALLVLRDMSPKDETGITQNGLRKCWESWMVKIGQGETYDALRRVERVAVVPRREAAFS